jgi:hypothetical protein
VAGLLIELRTLYPRADASKMVAAQPRLLLQAPEELRADAAQVCGREGFVGAGLWGAFVGAVAGKVVGPVLRGRGEERGVVVAHLGTGR